ncbi:MAG: UDP-N-acetylmuramoyl-tripeptide--D-alanyl-D-alanine ligase [Candidatus Nealsonbacteria bacterium]
MINSFYIFISVLWLIVFAKKLLFWTYLWQLKEYHIGRFRDHFRTHKGKRLILNWWLLLKVLILFGIYFSAEFVWTEIKINSVYLAVFVFFIEGAFFLKGVHRGIYKRPVITRKTAVILTTGLSLGALMIFSLFILDFSLTKFVFPLLLLDTIAMIFFSVLVLAYQPIAVILRNRLIRAAKRKRAGFPKLLVIGVTGSYGKTSTKEYLAALLSEKYKVLKTKEHQNSEVGISECILNELHEGHEIFVVEMGAYNRGGIKLLCDIVQPKIGVLTGINEQHMATFGSQENIIKAKYELIESLPKDGAAFFNGNNQYCRDLFQKSQIRKKLYGENAPSSYEENLAGAVAVAEFLGMNREIIERGVQKIKLSQASRIKKGANGIAIVDSTYSANPSGVIADLDYLTLRFPQGKKILVMPCLIELGKASKEVHLRIGKKIGEVCDLAIITTQDRLKEIREGAPNALFMENADDIAEKIKSFCRPGDVVLLESRVPSQIIKSLI